MPFPYSSPPHTRDVVRQWHWPPPHIPPLHTDLTPLPHPVPTWMDSDRHFIYFPTHHTFLPSLSLLYHAPHTMTFFLPTTTHHSPGTCLTLPPVHPVPAHHTCPCYLQFWVDCFVPTFYYPARFFTTPCLPHYHACHTYHLPFFWTCLGQVVSTHSAYHHLPAPSMPPPATLGSFTYTPALPVLRLTYPTLLRLHAPAYLHTWFSNTPRSTHTTTHHIHEPGFVLPTTLPVPKYLATTMPVLPPAHTLPPCLSLLPPPPPHTFWVHSPHTLPIPPAFILFCYLVPFCSVFYLHLPRFGHLFPVHHYLLPLIFPYLLCPFPRWHCVCLVGGRHLHFTFTGYLPQFPTFPHHCLFPDDILHLVTGPPTHSPSFILPLPLVPTMPPTHTYLHHTGLYISYHLCACFSTTTKHSHSSPILPLPFWCLYPAFPFLPTSVSLHSFDVVHSW